MIEDKGYESDLWQLDLLVDPVKPIHDSSEIPISAEKHLRASVIPNSEPLDLASNPATLLIVDTETTGLDFRKDKCLEVGVILFHVASRSILTQLSFLLPVKSNDAEAINNISPEITRVGQPWRQGLQYLEHLIDQADLLVAHNAAFDKQWFGKEPLPIVLKPWLCTMEDITWPEVRRLRPRPSVIDLALAYGVPVWNAHRALTDCSYIAEVFSRCDDLERLLAQGLEPRFLMRAKVSYDQRNLAREAGFRWNDPVKGAWARRLSKREAALLDFPVVFVDSRENFDAS